jgi:Tol biopolymer transport system component
LFRLSLPLAFGVIALIALVWFVKYGPVFNPPHPFVEAADGIILRQVLAEPGADIYGLAPSPRGRYLAFADWQESKGDLAIRDLETGETRQLTHDSGDSGWLEVVQEAVFSPNGKQLAYCWYTKDESYELRVVDFEGSKPRNLYSSGQDSMVLSDWSSDGRRLLARVSQRNDAESQEQGAPRQTFRIVTVTLDEGSVRILKSLDWRNPTKMCFSPDGCFVLYDAPAGVHPSNHDLYVLGVDDLRETPLLEHPANDLVLGWAPDGRSVLFASDRTGHWGMWLLPMDESGQADGPARLIKRDMGLIQPLGFAVDGSFFYSIRPGGPNIYEAKLDLDRCTIAEGPKPAVRRFMGSNRSPEWSPDGKYLAYVSRRNPLPKVNVLCIRSRETGREQELSPQLTWFRGLRWSQDGRSIMARGVDMKGRKGVYEIDVQTGTVATVLIEPEIGPTFPEWAPQVRAIYYVRNEWAKNLSQIMYRDLETGNEWEIARADQGTNFTGVQAAPDGRRIAVRIWRDEEQSTELVTILLNDGSQKRLLLTQEPEWVGAYTWTLDGEHLVFFRSKGSDSGVSELYLISASGGEPRRLGLEATGALNFDGLQLHPDGRSILYAATGGNDTPEIWVVEGLQESRGSS